MIHIFAIFLQLLYVLSVRGWWDVQVHACHSLDLAFISGHPTRYDPREIVLPLQSSDNVSPECLHKYLQNIKVDDNETRGYAFRERKREGKREREGEGRARKRCYVRN